MKDKNDPEKILDAYKKIDDFLRSQLEKAVIEQGSDISELASSYLLLLLVNELRTENTRRFIDKTVAEEFARATFENKPGLFRNAGDHALIIAGVWWQSLIRKIIGVDYYINMGRRAYQKAGESGPANLAGLFEELSLNFTEMVNILARTTRCMSESKMTDREILNIYETWLRTHSTLLAERLRSLGIDPVDIGTIKQ